LLALDTKDSGRDAAFISYGTHIDVVVTIKGPNKFLFIKLRVTTEKEQLSKNPNQ
jgi:hypothetical protein